MKSFIIFIFILIFLCILPSKTILFFQFNCISHANMLPSQDLLNKINVEVFEKIHHYDYTYLNVSNYVY